MIDFDRKPSKKSPEEVEFEKASEEYAQKFGAGYSFRIGLDFQTSRKQSRTFAAGLRTTTRNPRRTMNPATYIDGKGVKQWLAHIRASCPKIA